MAVPRLRDIFFSDQIKTLLNQNYYARWKDIKLISIRNPPIQTVLCNTDLRKFINRIQNPWTKFLFNMELCEGGI